MFKTSRLVTGGEFEAKKNLRIRAGWCNSSWSASGADTTYQYLWDLKCSSACATSAMSKSQQRTANCKQRFCLKSLKIRNMAIPAAAPEGVSDFPCNAYTHGRAVFISFASVAAVAPLKWRGFSVTLKLV
ncbi:hypothetical protein [Dryocola sp. BD626]|uniref:hypothetical protein n=1 Tax=Dryocola sp. BD626 TaxID=3133273 RepID=UPI003F503654